MAVSKPLEERNFYATNAIRYFVKARHHCPHGPVREHNSVRAASAEGRRVSWPAVLRRHSRGEGPGHSAQNSFSVCWGAYVSAGVGPYSALQPAWVGRE